MIAPCRCSCARPSLVSLNRAAVRENLSATTRKLKWANLHNNSTSLLWCQQRAEAETTIHFLSLTARGRKILATILTLLIQTRFIQGWFLVCGQPNPPDADDDVIQFSIQVNPVGNVIIGLELCSKSSIKARDVEIGPGKGYIIYNSQHASTFYYICL